MPLRRQRRNTAYLKPAISRLGPLDCDQDGQALHPGPDLRLISMARSSSASDQMTFGASQLGTLLNLDAPRDRRAKTKRLFILALCVLAVELSGAHADV